MGKIILSDLEVLGIESKKRSLEVVSQDGLNLCYVDCQDYEICKEAVKQNGRSLRYVKWDELKDEFSNEQLNDLYLEAIRGSGRAIAYIREEDREKYKKMFKYKTFFDYLLNDEVVAIQINEEWRFTVNSKDNMNKDEFIKWIDNDRIECIEFSTFDRNSSLFKQLEKTNREKYMDFLNIIDLIK
ncbi:DUF4116 domain-containing protein [Clostridioides difficile]|nr:DUF4116 domain-containing protein [Clostridioides difficile]MDK3168079.1 DUF4116 domain-containing protein [Clostridioides difficile]